MAIEVAIVDDEPEILEIFKQNLEQFEDIAAVHGFTDPFAALDQLPRLRPDIFLMDIRMHAMSGIQCTQRIKAVLPRVPVIFLTAMADQFSLFQALIAGASGYLLKPVTAAECRKAILEVLQGGAPLSREVARVLVHSFHASTAAPNEATGCLSPREQQIMACLFQGLRDKEIAQNLGIGTATVHTHLHRIFEKLQVSSRNEAIPKFLRMPLSARKGNHFS